jgi:heat shock protein HtpX
VVTIGEAARRRHKRRNVLQATLLLGGMIAMLALAGFLLAGRAGLLWVAGLSALALALRPEVPPRWVLRAYGARRLPIAAAPGLHRLVAALSERAGLPRPPELHYVPTAMLNAFAVGRPREAAIGVTDGLLRSRARSSAPASATWRSA